jgi:hypothetical protein
MCVDFVGAVLREGVHVASPAGDPPSAGKACLHGAWRQRYAAQFAPGGGPPKRGCVLFLSVAVSAIMGGCAAPSTGRQWDVAAVIL